MRNYGFALSVIPIDPDGNKQSRPFTEQAEGNKNPSYYITARPAQRYAIQITNGSSNHAAVEVSIDGNFIGGYPVELQPSKDSVITGFSSHITNTTFKEQPFQFPDSEPFLGTIRATIFAVVPKNGEMTRPIKSPTKIKKEANTIFCDRGQFDKSDKVLCQFTLKYRSPNARAQPAPVIDLTSDGEEEEEERERDTKRGQETNGEKRREVEKEKRREAEKEKRREAEKEKTMEVEKEKRRKREKEKRDVGKETSRDGGVARERGEEDMNGLDKEAPQDKGVDREGEGEGDTNRMEKESRNGRHEKGSDLEMTGSKGDTDGSEKEEGETGGEEDGEKGDNEKEDENESEDEEEAEGKEEEEGSSQEIGGMEVDAQETRDDIAGNKRNEDGETNSNGKGENGEEEDSEKDVVTFNEIGSEEEESENGESESEMEGEEGEEEEEGAGAREESGDGDVEMAEIKEERKEGEREKEKEKENGTDKEKANGEKAKKAEITCIDLTEISDDDITYNKRKALKRKKKFTIGKKKVTKRLRSVEDCPQTKEATPFPKYQVIDPFDVTHVPTTNQVLSEQAKSLKLRVLGQDPNKNKKIGKKFLDYLKKMLPIERKDKHEDLTKDKLMVILVRDDDPRVGLRGKRGVVAKIAMPKGTIIGPYAGKMWVEKEHDSHTSLFTKLAHNIYTHDFNIDIDGYKMIIDALQYGNLTRFINDPIIDPTRPYHSTNRVGEPNVKTTNVVYNRWPYVFIETLRDIQLGEEILMEYGEDYWASMNYIIREHAEMKDIQQQLLRPPPPV
eukprot:Phypoly_transcript_03328.p1 GENE.Phypoly_transcript_03328~~Phypoly_transcript_03328.p1  ORF type:complete len:789 (+),score=220.54 Phypoly_transcript_03328:87-2453(+)